MRKKIVLQLEHLDVNCATHKAAKQLKMYFKMYKAVVLLPT